MDNKIRLGILTATNIKTSTGSNNTVLNLLENLDPGTYAITILLIDDLVPPDLALTHDVMRKDPAYVDFSLIERHPSVSRISRLSDLSLGNIRNDFDAAIVAIYNVFGEDGRLPGLLDTLSVPYLSPSLKTSALCFDKELTKAVLRGYGIPVPPGFEVHKSAYSHLQLVSLIKRRGLTYPLIIKATSSGASRGVSVANDDSELVCAVEKAFTFSDEFVIETFLKGREFSVGVVGSYLEPHALPVVEIITGNEFFDYQAKYEAGKAREVCPAAVEKELEARIQALAVDAYRAVKAESHSRIDIVQSGNRLYVLEVNTFPGLTRASIFPKELSAAGSSLAAFLDSAIRNRMAKKNADEEKVKLNEPLVHIP